MSETEKRSVSVSHSQVPVLETLLSSVYEVTSWLDWWLSTCGGFREHLSGEVHANFERLMLSGSRALEFLGGQGVAVLGNLVLSRRDSLLLDVRSTVPVEEVARLRHAPLPSTASLVTPPLLETTLTKMRAASNDALVQKTLHPPRIPKKSVPVQGKASSASSAADHGGNTPVVPRSQQSSQSTSSSSSSSRGSRLRAVRVRLPFRKPPATPAAPVASKRGPGSGHCDVPTAPLRVGPVCAALEAVAGYRSRILVGIGPSGRISRPVFGLSSSPRPLSGIVSNVSG